MKRRYIIAATVGNALEFYDFLIYALFAIQIGHALFPVSSAYGSLMLSLATFGAGFATRPIGAWVLGGFADTAGRKPAMLLCFTLIGISIAAMALIPPYARIGIAAPVLGVIARMVQGFSLGGEIGANTVYLAEAAMPDRRGAAVSWQIASQFVALIIASWVGLTLSTLMKPAMLDAYGWRIAFLLGAAVVPFGFWLRTHIPETLAVAHTSILDPDPAHSAKESAATSEPAGGSVRLWRHHWKVIVLGLVVLAGGAIGSYSLVYITTYAQHTLHLPAKAGFLAQMAACTVGIPAAMVAGRLSDRYGRWPINVWSNLVFVLAIYPVFAWIVAARSEFSLISGMLVLGIVTVFPWASLYTCLAESLPAEIRSRALGTVQSVAVAVFGGSTQLVATWLIHVTGSAMAPAWYLIGAAGIAEIAFILLPETAPARLMATMRPQLRLRTHEDS